MKLPQKFTEVMTRLLGEEFEAYKDSFSFGRVYGLRVNTEKISVDDFLKITPFQLKPIPWVENGFFYDGSSAVTKHPHYHAGLYYIQEPSAMIPADRLPVHRGENVLDLCAAPGGKATELGSRLRGSGLLVANDISSTRSKGLLKNLELFGIKNILVTSENSDRMLSYFPEFFDKILIDAPCSGEGMFRKDPAMMKSWEERGPEYYVPIQRELLLNAARMLKPGGMLLYSTCTFSMSENEENICWLLEQRPDFSLVHPCWYEGFSKGISVQGEKHRDMEECIRVWPQRMQGEGHFAALLCKGEDCGYQELQVKKGNAVKKSPVPKEWEAFASKNLNLSFAGYRITEYENRVYALPENIPVIKGLRFLRTGLYLGELKKNRFEPSQALASSMKAADAKNVFSFSQQDERVVRYLKGETLELTDEESQSLSSGWVLVCVDGYALGFAKLGGTTLKNKYYAGWRIQ